MSVWRALTTVTMMLSVPTQTGVFIAPVMLDTVEVVQIVKVCGDSRLLGCRKIRNSNARPNYVVSFN